MEEEIPFRTLRGRTKKHRKLFFLYETKQNKKVMVEVFKRLKETHMMNRKLLTAAGYGERGKNEGSTGRDINTRNKRSRRWKGSIGVYPNL